ncbi:MAG: DUF4148 domain-containing protein [Rubrivivax sp.]|nr:DUF4148 domain-containing protein [Rubrivivax sp.]
MNAKRITFVAAAVLASLMGAARADDITPDPYRDWVSTRTRAEVQAEVLAARASGELARAHGEDGGSFAFAQEVYVATRTRADVLAEVLAERASGALLAFTGEDSGSAWLARAGQAAEAMRFAALKR